MMLPTLRALGSNLYTQTPYPSSPLSIHPCQGRATLSLPSEHVLPQQRSKRVCLRSQIRFVSSSFMSGLRLRQYQPISNPNEEEEENE